MDGHLSFFHSFLWGSLFSYYFLPLGLDSLVKTSMFFLLGLFFLLCAMDQEDRNAENKNLIDKKKQGWILALALGLFLGQANVNLHRIHLDEEQFPRQSGIISFRWKGSIAGRKGDFGLLRADSGPFVGKTFISASPVSEMEAILQVGQREEAWAFYLPLDKSPYRGEFNQESWLESKGISGQVRLTRRIVRNRPNSLQILGNKIKYYFLKRTDDLGGQAGSFFRRIFLGRSDHLGFELKDPMKNLGLAHLLAASGLHVNLLFNWGLQVLAGLGLRRKMADRILFPLLIAYAGLLSFPASIVRAGLFLFFQEEATLNKGKLNFISTFLLSLTLYLTFRPYAAYDLGLLLSFACVLAINLVGEIGKLHPLKGSFLKDVRTSFWINLFTFPFLTTVTKTFSPVILLANPLAIPFFGKLFALGLTAYLVVHLPLLGDIIAGLYRLAYEIFSALIYGLDALDFLRTPIKLVSPFSACYFLALLFLIFGRLGWWKAWSRLSHRLNFWERKRLEEEVMDFLYFFFVIVFSLNLSPKADRLTALDVGQGDSFLLQSQAGNFLFDCGGKINFQTMKNEEALLFVDKLKSKGVDSLEGIFLSHRDYDHIGNLESLVSSLPVKRIFLSPLSDGSSARDLLPSSFREKGGTGAIPLIPLERGRTYTWSDCGGEIRIRVIREGIFDSKSPNRDSAVLLLDFGPRVLLMGDREEDLTPEEEAGLKGEVDLLKVAHHGSRKGSSLNFLENIRPRAAILSSGRNNSYGHPHQEVLDRLHQTQIPYYRTSSLGDICFEVRGEGKGEREFEVVTKETQVRKDLGRLSVHWILFCLLFIGNRQLRRSPEGDAEWKWRG